MLNVARIHWLAVAAIAVTPLFTTGLTWAGDSSASGARGQASLPKPTGPVLLSIGGDIGLTNQTGEARFDLQMLESLPVTRFKTNTPWRDEPATFDGIRLNDLLAAVHARSSEFLAVALNDYEMEISDLDLERYPIIVAYRENNQPMSVRNLGPLRIMFPFDDFPELLNQSNMTMSVWQLTQMHIH